MTQLDFFNDISKGRHNDNSKIAHAKLKPVKKNQIKEVFQLNNGIRCTMEIAEIMNVPLHKISGRFSELKALGRLIYVDKKTYKESTYSVYKKLETLIKTANEVKRK